MGSWNRPGRCPRRCSCLMAWPISPPGGSRWPTAEILVFAADPATGKLAWVERLNSVPQQGFYECPRPWSSTISTCCTRRAKAWACMARMARPQDRQDVDRSLGGLRPAQHGRRIGDGPAELLVHHAPRWPRIASYTPLRSLAVYRDNVLYGCLQGSSTVFRRDFDLEGGEQFGPRSGSPAGGLQPQQAGRDALAQRPTGPEGRVEDGPFRAGQGLAADPCHGGAARPAAAGGRRRWPVAVISARGEPLAEAALAEPLWDGMAIAGGKPLRHAAGQAALPGGGARERDRHGR